MSGEIRLMDMNIALSQYGISRFKANHKVIRAIDLDNQVVFGGFEKSPSIDTPREALTALFYCSPITITELPKGKEGARRLGAMWMRAIAEDPKNSANYTKALDKICQRSGVCYEEIRSYYATSIEKLVFTTGKKHLGRLYSNAELKNGTLRPVVNYYLNPVESNLNLIAVTAKNSKSRRAYISMLNELNSNLSGTVNIKIFNM